MSDSIKKAIQQVYEQILKEIDKDPKRFERVDADSVTLTLKYSPKAAMHGEESGLDDHRCMICTPRGCRPC